MSPKKHRLLLGAHMSIAGGLEKSIERGNSIGCNTIQIFTKSNRQWNANPLTPEQASLFKDTAKKLSIAPIIEHATYLINIASVDKKTEHASIKALKDELMRCDMLNIPNLVLHPGSFGTGTAEQGLEKIIENLGEIIATTPSKTMITLEIMAGQGSSLCSTFDQIATIREKTASGKKLGVCFDTCHAFAAGYDLRTPESYEKAWKDFDEIIGIGALSVLHINDSKKGLGCNVDRHEHIGKGELGLEAFRLLFNDPRFFDIPKILETPKVTEEPFTEDKMNIATIHSLLSPATKKILGVVA